MTTVFRDWRLGVVVFVVVLSIFAVASLAVRTTYTAQSRLMVLFSKEYTARSDIGDTPNFLPDQAQMVRTEMELLESPLLATKVIEDLGLEVLFPDMLRAPWWKESANSLRMILAQRLGPLGGALQPKNKADSHDLLNRAALRFAKALSVSPVKDANVLAISFTHSDPEVAAGVVNTLVTYYLEQRQAIFNQSKSKQLMVERDRYTDRLAQADRDLEDFKTKYQISSFADQKAALLRQQADILNDRISTRTRLDEVVARVAELRTVLAQVPKDVPLYDEKGNVDAGDNVRAALLTLRLRRTELLTKFLDTSQFIKDLDEQIRAADEQLRNTPHKGQDAKRIGRNTVYDQLEGDALRQEAEEQSLRARLVSLEGQLAVVNQRLTEFDHLERSFNSLTLNRGIIEQNLKTYSQKLEEAQIQENFDRAQNANVRVIETAEPPAEGSAVGRLVIAVGFATGLVMAFIVILLLDATRDEMITPEAASRKLRLPVLVAIAHKNPPKPRSWRMVLGDATAVLFHRRNAVARAGGAG